VSKENISLILRVCREIVAHLSHTDTIHGWAAHTAESEPCGCLC